MNQYFTTGRWTVNPENRAAFIEAWSRFAGWGSGSPGTGTLELMQDLDEPETFISIGDWDTYESIRSWKDAPEFKEQIAQVLQYVSGFEPRNLSLVATAREGASQQHAAVAIT
jgi:heme-degrading monooxygenase HmoA